MAVVAWNVALAAPIRTVAKVGVPARLEDKSRRRTIWPFAMVPGAVVKGALLMLYSPPCTLIGALEMPEICTASEVIVALRGTSTASTKAKDGESTGLKYSDTFESYAIFG